MTASLEIRHDRTRRRFETDVAGGVGFVAYEQEGNVLRLHHTEVPRAAEGRGVAAQLVKAALSHAEANGLDVHPTCAYVRGYMTRHPETHALLADGARL